MKEFIEQQIISAVRNILTGKVNKLLQEFDFQIPLIEFGNYGGVSAVMPAVVLSSCEQTEKERIIKQDVYSATITFSVPETADSETYCFAYANAFQKALCDDATLGGVSDRAIMTSKKYIPPKKPNCGMEWELVISLKVTVEGMSV